MGGFKSPLFVLGLASGGIQAGFRTPLPVFPGGSAGIQAGFRTVLPLFPLGAVATPEEGRRKGSGRLFIDDEEILAVIMAISVRDSYRG